MLYLRLFYEFFKTGLFAVGGGMATIPFLYDMADKYPDWFTRNDVANMIAVGESTPGPIGVTRPSVAITAPRMAQGSPPMLPPVIYPT